MPKPMDATCKGMLEESPLDWAHLVSLPADDGEVVDADVSTYTGAADKVLHIRRPTECILHVEFQTGPDVWLPSRTHLYNGLIEDRHRLPVVSAVILLRREANLSNLTGLYERGLPGHEPYLRFRYQVVRVWELPVEPLLAGGFGTLPLAPISAVTTEDLPRVIERMKKRLVRQGALAARLWTATYVLMGSRYDEAMVDKLLEGVLDMEESVTYQAIIRKGEARGLAKGALEEARKLLLMVGTEKFGNPSRVVQAAVEAIDEPGRLERLTAQVIHVDSWSELLRHAPKAKSPSSRRK